MRLPVLLFASALLCRALDPVPDRLVVLTFDDSARSHYTVARDVLKKHGFGATFFVTEGLTYRKNPAAYMSWAEIRTLHDEGFEIGNHGLDHISVTPATAARLEEQLDGVAARCRAAGIPKPVSFAWPGNAIALEGLSALRKHGIIFARRGGSPEYDRRTGLGVAYEPGRDHPHLIPSVAVPRPGWTVKMFADAVAQARNGRIAVVQFHGVPETEHPWVHTTREQFEKYMQVLSDGGYRVVALRDLARYVDASDTPRDPMEIVNLRKKLFGQR